MTSEKGGPPFKFNTVEELKKAIQGYFNSLLVEDPKTKLRVQMELATVTGLGLYIGLTRQGIIGYEKRDQLHDVIRRAKQMIEAQLESALYSGKPCAGVIFSLKNNWGWTDTIHNINEDTAYDGAKDELMQDAVFEKTRAKLRLVGELKDSQKLDSPIIEED